MLLLVAVASIPIVSGGAAAVNSDIVPNQTELLQEAQGEEEEYVIAISDDVRIVEYSYTDAGELSVLFESDKRTSVTITDASRPIQGAIQIPRKTTSIAEGKTEVTFTVVNADNPAVTVDADDNLIGLGEQSFGLFSGNATWTYVRAAAVAGAVGALLPIGYVAVKKRKEQQEEVDRLI